MTQILIDTMIRGSLLALLAVGLTMVYGTLRFPNIAHVEFATFGAYGIVALTSARLTLVPSIAVSLLATVLFGILTYRLLFRRLLRTSPMIAMIGSLALAIIVRALLQLLFGSRPKPLDLPLERGIEIGDGVVTPSDIRLVVVASVLLVFAFALVRWTRLGRHIRAVASNPELAAVSGVNRGRVVDAVWAIAALLGGVAGVLLAIDSTASPEMGFNLMLPMFAAAIVGGLGSMAGAVIAAFGLSLAEAVMLSIDFGGLIDGAASIPVSYRPAIAFVVLVIALVVRPQGLLGRSVRRG